MFGDRNAPATVVLMGDSHAAQWFPALDALGREQHWRLVSLTKSGCPPAEATIWVGTFDRAYTECDAWREAAFKRIAELFQGRLAGIPLEAHPDADNILN